MLRVALYVCPQTVCSSLSMAQDAFGLANHLHGMALFQLQRFSLDGAPVQLDFARIAVDGGLALAERADLLILPATGSAVEQTLTANATLLPWLAQRRHQQLASLCSSAFLLAAAGLLDGRRATTHWIFSEQFARRFPRVQLQAERSVTDDGQLLCSAGSTTGSDLLLHIIRRFASPQLAIECSKKLLVDSAERLQTPYMSASFNKAHQDAEVLRVQIWLEKHSAERIAIDEVAARFALSPRHLIRRFKDATGQTPVQYLQNLRLERAKHLLEASQENFERITQQVGYEDGSSFRRLFKERVGLSPGAYRRRFNRPA